MKTWKHIDRYLPAMTLLLLALLVLSGCGDLGDDTTGINTNTPTVTTWEDDVVPGVITPLGCIGCHSASLPNGGLNLQDYASWIDATSNSLSNPYVADGDPDNSEIIMRLSANGAPQMPPTGNTATAAQVEIVRTWISDGAYQSMDDVPQE